MTVHEGGCLCGAVRYKVEGEPLMAGACYCRDCQIVAGGGCTYGAAYLTDALTVTKGTTRAFVVKADSGADVSRNFCGNCGVHLFASNSSHPQFLSIKIGTLDDPSWFKSQGSIWTSSAQPWHRIETDLPTWEKEPDIQEP